MKRWSRLRAKASVVGLALFLVVGWVGVTTVGKLGGVDSGEHLLYAQYLDAHGRLPPRALNYEYASPPLFAATAVAAERAVRHLPRPSPSKCRLNPVDATRSGCCSSRPVRSLTADGPPARRPESAAAAALVLAALWGLDEAISLARAARRGRPDS